MEDVGKFYGRSVYFTAISYFYGHLVYFMTIWYILRSFWYIVPILVYCTKKNLATLQETRAQASHQLMGNTL
jgi:hypothetical protein